LDDNSWRETARAEHDAAFDAFAARGKLCEVDLDRLFQNEDFLRSIFENRKSDWKEGSSNMKRRKTTKKERK